MHDNVRNGLSKSPILTERLWQAFASAAVRKVQSSADLTDQELAESIGCSAATVGNARNMKGELLGRTFSNLLRVDPFALEAVLNHFGRRSVPIEAKCDTDALVSTSAAVASIARAQAKHSPGKREITDSECLDIEDELDDAIEALSALKQRAIQIRAERAA